MVHNEIALRQKLEQMATPELKELLEGETGKDVPDDDLVLLVLDILEARTMDKPIVLTPGEQAAWKTYQKRARKRAGGVPRWVRTAVAAAATLVLVFGMMFVAMPQEAKAGGIYDVIAKCSDLALRFFSPGNVTETLEYEFHTDHPGLQKLHDTVVEYGYDGPAVPMWVPEEYDELLLLEVDESPRSICITAVLASDNNSMVISYSIYDSVAPREYDKDDLEPKTLELFGTKYQYIENLENYSAVWQRDNIDGFITLDCQEEILHRILKSIYVMEGML